MSQPRETLASARLWLAFATMLLVSGIPNTFPVFFPVLLEEFGGSRGATASTVSMLWLGGAVLGPLAGYSVARWDPRVVVSVGLGAVAGGLALGTVASSLGAFLLAVGLGGGIGIGLTGMVPHAALIADAYVRRRGLAIGIAFSGSMAAYVLAPLAQWGIDGLGWRGTFGAYVVAILLLLPVVWRVHPRRLQAAEASTGGPSSGGHPLRAIVGSVPFWSLFVVFASPPLFGYLAVTQHALYFTARGLSAGEAALLLGVGGVLSAGGRAMAGLVADRLGGPRAGFLSFGCSLIGLLCLVGMEAWPGRLLAYGYVLFLFLPLGSRATIVSVLVSRFTPARHYGLIFGLLGVGNSIGAALGPWLSGALYDLSGSYLVIYGAALAILLAGILALAIFAWVTADRAPARPAARP